MANEGSDDVDLDLFYANMAHHPAKPASIPKKPVQGLTATPQPHNESKIDDYICVTESAFRPRRIPLDEHDTVTYDAYGIQPSHSVKHTPRDQVNNAREVACRNREEFLSNWESTLNSRKEQLASLELTIDEFDCQLEERAIKSENILNTIEKREKECSERLKQLEAKMKLLEQKEKHALSIEARIEDIGRAGIAGQQKSALLLDEKPIQIDSALSVTSQPHSDQTEIMALRAEIQRREDVERTMREQVSAILS